jgi:hypothetical protein
MGKYRQGGRIMTRIRCGGKVSACIGIMVALLLVLTSCSGLTPSESALSHPAKEKEQEPVSSYYDFGDVLIPKELKVDKKSSFVFRTPGLTAGVVSLEGRVEINSLISFFDNNMAKDNWRLVSSFKSPRTMMLFHKENRWCVINIFEKKFNTYVEVWVAPTVDEADVGLLK